MPDDSRHYFHGFSPAAIEYLKDLTVNNNKPWFEEHKEDYKKLLQEPLQGLVMELSEFMLSIDPYFDVTPGKAISRIHRDTRFSKNKSPYRDTMWLTFKRSAKEWSTNPAFFFELSPHSYRYGMGYFSADPETMEGFRERMDTSVEEFKKAIAFYPQQQIFTLEGDKYKRVLDKTKPGELADWYQRKNLYLVCLREIDGRLFSRELAAELIANFQIISGFYQYLLHIKDRRRQAK
ncbi:DUF2461 domain-containing protein [Gorillibacterium timonense]|uniref:DUF2461 domain-containing protein n=1 Tax=Gorillibacterium timonense TaxID=1689269 RepID=UPI00071D2C53|nr:DUF2461 domain-containing protein [Gorillibacterium timonense]